MTSRPDFGWIPRGLNRLEAAHYVGVGPDKFDEMVSDRRMPKPREIDRRIIWDRVELDIAFSELPHRGAGNFFDRAAS